MDMEAMGKVRSIVGRHFGVAEVRDDAHFTEDLGGDCTDCIVVALALEEAFSVSIPSFGSRPISSVAEAAARLTPLMRLTA